MNKEDLTEVVVTTEVGSFRLGIDERSAPISAANFLAYVDGGHLEGGAIYRIVTLANQPPGTAHKIEVIQWGWQAKPEQTDPPFPPIAHEPTSITGLTHADGVLSMARREPGTAGPAFFVCIGDQPELDEGGGRNPDGAGFAAFGKLVDGQDVIAAIFARAEDVERIRKPIAVLAARRTSGM